MGLVCRLAQGEKTQTRVDETGKIDWRSVTPGWGEYGSGWHWWGSMRREEGEEEDDLSEAVDGDSSPNPHETNRLLS